MPSTALASTSLTRNVADGVDLTAALTAADTVNGNHFANDGNTLLRASGSGASSVVTVKFASGQIDGTSVTPAGKVYNVAAAGDRLIGPFPTSIYGTTVEVSVSAAVDLAVLQPAN